MNKVTKSALDLLESLDEDLLKEVLRISALIADPLSQELIKEASLEEPNKQGEGETEVVV